MNIAAIVLAAGKSSRMGFNKLLADVGGKPLVVRTIENIVASKVSTIIVVTGHAAQEIELALAHANVKIVHNAGYASGLASSVKVGVGSARGFDGALICLGDMPLVSADIIDRMIAAFDPSQGRQLVVPVRHGEIGNPVLWGARFFPELKNLEGDRGARGLIELHRAELTEIMVADESASLDADTPEALAHIKSIVGS